MQAIPIAQKDIDAVSESPTGISVAGDAVVRYIDSLSGLVANGTGHIGDNAFFPAFDFNLTYSPGLAGAFLYKGYYKFVPNNTQEETLRQSIVINPSMVYRLRVLVRQNSVVGDYSEYLKGQLHLQYMGLDFRDVDNKPIKAPHHMYRPGSRTELAQDLKPGDDKIHLVDATGWNNTLAQTYRRGIAFAIYENSLGIIDPGYTRLKSSYSLWDVGAVDYESNIITLNSPWDYTNDKDPSGHWLAGTPVWNTDAGGSYKYVFVSGVTMPSMDAWYQCDSRIGGVDKSGRNYAYSFPPGTHSAALMHLPNYSNRAGGWGAYPDTGSDTEVLIAGVRIDADITGKVFYREIDGAPRLYSLEGSAESDYTSDGTVDFALFNGMTIKELS